LFTINCTGFSGKKTKLFSLVFQKKKKLNIATVEHGSTVPKNKHEKQQNAASQSCGWTAKISGPYQAKSVLFPLPNIKMCGCG